MRMHRFIGQFDLSQSQLELVDRDLVHQLSRVLRLKVGDSLVLCAGTGREAVGHIEQISKEMVTVYIDERRDVQTEPSRDVHLYCAGLRRENFELVVQKATEVGVSQITPLRTSRTVKGAVKVERLQLIAKEAAEQSGRGRIPIINPLTELPSALSAEPGKKLWCDFDGVEFSSLTPLPETVAIFIGPEGGWDETERALAAQSGATTLSLGPRVLRAETAAVIASYLAVLA